MWHKVSLNPALRPLLVLNIWGNSSLFFKTWCEWAFRHPKVWVFLWNSQEQGISQKLLLFSLPLSFRVQTLAISSTIFSCLLVTSRVSLLAGQTVPAFQHQHCPEILSLTPVTHYSNVSSFMMAQQIAETWGSGSLPRNRVTLGSLSEKSVTLFYYFFFPPFPAEVFWNRNVISWMKHAMSSPEGLYEAAQIKASHSACLPMY